MSDAAKNKIEKLTEKYESRIAALRERGKEAASVTTTLVGAGMGGAAHGVSKHYLHDKKIAGQLTADMAVSGGIVALPFLVPGQKNRRMLIGPAAGVVGAETSQLIQASLAASEKQKAAAPAAVAPAAVRSAVVQQLPQSTGVQLPFAPAQAAQVVPFARVATR